MYFSGGGNCLAYSEIQSSNSLVYTGDIQLTLQFREMAVLMSIMMVWIRFSLSVYSCSDSLACSLAKLKYKTEFKWTVCSILKIVILL